MSKINDRKLDHLRIVREENVEPLPSSFDAVKLPYKALPEINLSDVDTSAQFLGYKLKFPFVISSMTGGPAKAADINKNLAIAAQQTGVALGLGSMRVILRDQAAIKSFDVKKYCPDIPLLANFGLVQLNYGYTADHINKIIDSVKADGIFLHINPLQEAVQPEGTTNFAKLLDRLAAELPKIEKPVVIKEVGCGIDAASALALSQIGITWIDVSGTGGTSWPWVEGYRREDDLGYLFRDVGIPTTQALHDAAGIAGLNLIAGGGVRSGLDIAKALYCKAKLATAAKPLLEAALSSPEACTQILLTWKKQLEVAMFVCGWQKISDIKKPL